MRLCDVDGKHSMAFVEEQWRKQLYSIDLADNTAMRALAKDLGMSEARAMVDL